jgi:cytoskeletal protein CcmA (bactofilin family)
MFFKEWTRGKDRGGSYLGDNVGGTGDINTNGLIRIDGHWEGNINADSIVIGEASLVKGNLKAKNIVINGTVQGKLEATELIEIHDKGNVQGDIKTARLVVVEKGVLQGKCHILRDMDEKVLEIASREVSKGKKVSERSE